MTIRMMPGNRRQTRSQRLSFQLDTNGDNDNVHDAGQNGDNDNVHDAVQKCLSLNGDNDSVHDAGQTLSPSTSIKEIQYQHRGRTTAYVISTKSSADSDDDDDDTTVLDDEEVGLLLFQLRLAPTTMTTSTTLSSCRF